MADRSRPLSVTITLVILIVWHSGALAAVLTRLIWFPHHFLHPTMPSAVVAGLPLIGNTVCLVAAVAMLGARHWARVLYLVTLGLLYLAVGTMYLLHGSRMTTVATRITIIAFYLIIVWLLTRKTASTYFRDRAAEPTNS